MAVRTRRLPGFRFEVQPPPLTEVLPRMDVAVVVGFAAAGPLHVPVLVEDAARFAAVFCGDAPLAWDPERGETVYAYLAPAVRAFFRNGGRRCWVVRVAGPGAAVNRFTVPGLRRLDEQGEPATVTLQARSEGSWSDTLEVATALAAETLAAEGWDATPASPPRMFELVLSAPDAVANGDLLRLTFLEDDLVLLLAVRTEFGRITTRVTDGTALWFAKDKPTQPIAVPPQLPARLSGVERLTFELRVRQGQDSSWRLGDMGFAPGHPRYWGGLPCDADLYQTPQKPQFWNAVADPRFPLAAAPGSDATCFPLSMPLVADNYAGSEAQAATALERDGLARFDATLFFDARDPRALRALLETGAGDLLAEADYQRYQGPSPRSLGGIYAALDIDEATLLVVPDAVHRGWSPATVEEPTSPVESSPLARPEWWHFLPCDPPPQIPKVRQPEPGHFLDCDLRIVPAPTLMKEDNPEHVGTFTLSWSEVADAAYVLEEATDPTFAGAAPVFTGTATRFDIYGRRAAEYFYRVRSVMGGVSSDYSNGVAVRVAPASRWQLNPAEDYSDQTLLVLQRALLRLCAARGDLLAVLALPEHYREDEAVAHVAKLSSTGPSVPLVLDGSPPMTALSMPLHAGEAGAFSYGAVYHPWLIGREENASDALRRTPPDGAACGILARRALARGAWIAPANEALHGVAALTPAIGRGQRLNLQTAQVNLLRQEPHGFVVLGADTLSLDEDLRPINVRRLLILLRRLALRLGATYVFEPNDDSFRRAVQRGFEAQLEYLFVRGAFAGKSPETSYQVVTSDSVNTLRSVEQGRFIVELRVAPSLPMTFLTIRLVQTGDRGLVTEVR